MSHTNEPQSSNDKSSSAISRRAVLAAGGALSLSAALAPLAEAAEEDPKVPKPADGRRGGAWDGPTPGVMWPVVDSGLGSGTICAHGHHLFSTTPPSEVRVVARLGVKPNPLPTLPYQDSVAAACTGSGGEFVFNEICNAPLTGVGCSTAGMWNHVLYWARRLPSTPWVCIASNFKGYTASNLHCHGTAELPCPCQTIAEKAAGKEAKKAIGAKPAKLEGSLVTMAGPTKGHLRWKAKKDSEESSKGIMCAHGSTSMAMAKQIAICCLDGIQLPDDPTAKPTPAAQGEPFAKADVDAEGKFAFSEELGNPVPVPVVGNGSHLFIWVQTEDGEWHVHEGIFNFATKNTTGDLGCQAMMKKEEPAGAAMSAAADPPHSNAANTITVTGPGLIEPWPVRSLSPFSSRGKICLHGSASKGTEYPSQIWVLLKDDFLGTVPPRPQLGAVELHCIGEHGEFVFNDQSDHGPLADAVHSASGEMNHIIIWAKFRGGWETYGFEFEGVTSTQLHCHDCDAIAAPNC